MQSAVLHALEFNRIREALASLTSTPLGRERALALEPSVEAGEMQSRLETTLEAVAFLKGGGSLSIDAPENLLEILAALDVADEPLAPMQLLGLATFIESVDRVAGTLQTPADLAAAGVSSPRHLAEIAARVQSFATETAAVRKAVLPAGDVSDDASPALREIRDALRRQRAKLRSTLEGLVRGRETSKYLQDQIVTDRNGRYVIVVRAEYRTALPGIVHGSSASGASLYLEPLTTVDLNNDIVALAEREKAEVRRILLALTDAFRSRAADLDASIDAAGEIDELHAKARLAARVDGAVPGLTNDGRIEFRGARHPLLIPAVRDLLRTDLFTMKNMKNMKSVNEELHDLHGLHGENGPATVVASDLVIVPPTRALIISGPNTGGKTVALKAVGLLALMAQAGLLIPVDDGSQFTPCRSIFAEIGDEQSIAASLSTFSARVANLVAMERALELPALVLLDELGSGTDPVEGGALGAALVDHFRRRGAIVVATTHDDALKSYAATTDGVAAAAFGFNAETYAPTYRLMYGAPGRSLALEIAERLGMPAPVIADARARRSGRESQLAAHLARVDQELAALERERSAAATERDEIARQREALQAREARLAEREAVLKKRLDDKLSERLREAKAEVDAVIADLKNKADALADRAGRRAQGRGPVLSTGELGGLRAETRAALGAIGGSLGRPTHTPDDDALTGPPVVGQTVFVSGLGVEGIVRGASTRDADVEIRGKRMRVPIAALRKAVVRPQATGGRRQEGGGPQAAGGGRQAAASSLSPAASRELVVIGATVDEALDRAEKFLDDALLADEKRLRVIHGHGTGRLRDALRAYFREHPLVATVASAPDNEGGQGATIVELKD